MAKSQKSYIKSVESADPYVNGLMSGNQWNTELYSSSSGTEALTFSFIEERVQGKGNGHELEEWTDDEIVDIVRIFNEIEAITKLNIEVVLPADFEVSKLAEIENNTIEIDLDSAPANAEIRFFKQDLSTYTEGQTNYPGQGQHVDVYFDSELMAANDEMYNTLLFYHEIGHAMGLQHTFDNGKLGAYPDPEATVNADDPFGSVMSYSGWEDSQPDLQQWSETDQAALAWMYGPA